MMNYIEKTINTALTQRFPDQIEFKAADVKSIAMENGLSDS